MLLPKNKAVFYLIYNQSINQYDSCWKVIWPILVDPLNPPNGGRVAESGMFVYPPSLGEHRGETITVGLINIYKLAHHAIAQEKSLPGEPYMAVGHLYQALSGQSS